MRNFFRKQFDPTQEPKDVPKEGAALFLDALWSNALQLFLTGLLTLVLCLPIVTAPAALCAMNRVCRKLIRDGYVFLKESYFGEFKQSFFRALVIGALYCGFFLSGFISICYGIAVADSQWGLFAKIFGFAEIGLTFLLSSWSFLLMSLQDLPVGKLIRNTIAMILLEPLCDMKILLITGLTAAGAWCLFPWSLFAIPLLPGLVQFSLCWVTGEPIQKRIVDRANAA